MKAPFGEPFRLRTFADDAAFVFYSGAMNDLQLTFGILGNRQPRIFLFN